MPGPGQRGAGAEGEPGVWGQRAPCLGGLGALGEDGTGRVQEGQDELWAIRGLTCHANPPNPREAGPPCAPCHLCPRPWPRIQYVFFPFCKYRPPSLSSPSQHGQLSP